jgi:4-amino-4-deoxy-L-arabinose transferase-like glycosyltransferase
MKSRLWLALSLIAILWLATALRFHRLEAQSLWNDEGNSARLSERSISLIVEGTASDIHPPLYYLMLHGWRSLLGDSEFALRALSAFAGVAVVAGTYGVARMLLSRTVGALLAPLLAALHPALVYYSQEARMYELLALWAVLATLLFVRWLGAQRRSLWLALAYVLVTAAGLYTHYFYPTVLAAHGFVLALWLLLSWRQSSSGSLISHAWRPLLRWGALVFVALLLYLPWLPIFVRQAGGRSTDELSPGEFLERVGRWLLFGGTVEDGTFWRTATIAIAALLLLLLAHRAREGAKRLLARLLPVSMVIIPTVFMLLAGTTREPYFKFMVVAVPFLVLLIAHLSSEAWEVRQQLVRRGPRIGQLWIPLAAALLLALVLVGNGQSLSNLYYDPAFARDNYRGIAQRIDAAAHPNDGIILNAANQWEVFTYYHREGAPVYPIPRGGPDAAQVEAELQEISARHDRLYALFWGEAERDPQRLVERWLDQHAFKAQEEWVGDVRFVTYAVPPEPAEEMEVEAGVTFGQEIRLLGYTLRGNPLAAGDIVQVTLYWQAVEAPAQRYKFFLHLLDGAGNLVAQRDAEPGGNMAPTTEWAAGETVVDNHGVLAPADLSPGSYELYVGLYALHDPQQRLTFEEQGEVKDRYHLGTITVQ